MSASKLSYQVNKKFSPHLESLDFHKMHRARNWNKASNNVLCAVQMIPLNNQQGDLGDVETGSVQVTVGIEYVRSHLGNSLRLRDGLLADGIGICSVRSSLTRGTDTAGPERSDIWDIGKLTPAELIADVIAAFDAQAIPFFEQWTNPQFAYDRLLAGVDRAYPDGTGPLGSAQLFMSARPNSIASFYVLSELAFRLGRFEEEADYLERVIEMRGGGPKHEQRLATLRQPKG